MEMAFTDFFWYPQENLNFRAQWSKCNSTRLSSAKTVLKSSPYVYSVCCSVCLPPATSLCPRPLWPSTLKRTIWEGISGSWGELIFLQGMELLPGPPLRGCEQNPGGHNCIHLSFPHTSIITNHGIFPSCWSLSENVCLMSQSSTSVLGSQGPSLFFSYIPQLRVTAQQWSISTNRNNICLPDTPYRNVLSYGPIFLKEMLQYQKKTNQKLMDKSLPCKEKILIQKTEAIFLKIIIPFCVMFKIINTHMCARTHTFLWTNHISQFAMWLWNRTLFWKVLKPETWTQ